MVTDHGRARLLSLGMLSLLEYMVDNSLQLLVLITEAGAKAKMHFASFRILPAHSPLFLSPNLRLEVLQSGLKLAVSKNKFPVELQWFLPLPFGQVPQLYYEHLKPFVPVVEHLPSGLHHLPR